ncbi:hypothetical protein JZ751_004776, partial [Albula glossodonta]
MSCIRTDATRNVCWKYPTFDSVCTDIFCQPVVLKCSHSFCGTCLLNHWSSSGGRDCPICRAVSGDDPILNLTLRNTCESYLRERERLGSVRPCSLHGEPLKVFCLEDQQLICVDCLTQQHHGHSFCPLEAMLPQCKVSGWEPGIYKLV